MRNYGLDTGGTVYRNTRSSVKVEDWPVFFEWMQAKDSWEFLAKRAADSIVKEFLEETGHLPPGLSISTEQTLGVRK